MNQWVRSGFAFLFLLGFAQASFAQADEGWGDLGYSKPVTEVEAIPSSLDAEATDVIEPSPQALQSVESSYSSADVEPEAIAPKRDTAPIATATKVRGGSDEPKAEKKAPARSFGNISTTRNTYGVETEENPGVQFYAAPFGGMTSLVGNTTVDSSARFALGAQVGLLLTSNLMVNVNYTYSEQNLSSPRSTTAQVGGMPAGIPELFNFKSNHIELGGKLFFLGRESRVRPFFGGGFGWGKSSLAYNSMFVMSTGGQAQYDRDYSINQFDGFGELGTEVAITRNIVVNAAFRLRGILSTTASATNAEEAQNYDSTRLQVGSSLSRTASYTLGAGLGIYF